VVYAVVGFGLVAVSLLGYRFVKAWQRESARIEQTLAEFDAEKAASPAHGHR
jgi:hypothetical protein